MNSGSMVVGCPHCGGQIVSDQSLAGQVVGCPHCSGRVLMPAIAMAPPPPPLAAVPIATTPSEPLDFLDAPAAPHHHRYHYGPTSAMTLPAHGFGGRADVNPVVWFWTTGPAVLISAIVIGIVAVAIEFINAAR